MLFPKLRGLLFGRFLAAACQRWERSRRERRLAQVRPLRLQRRGRLSDDHGALVQVLEPRTMLTIDLGDAPSPYPTTIAENGARHTERGRRLGPRGMVSWTARIRPVPIPTTRRGAMMKTV